MKKITTFLAAIMLIVSFANAQGLQAHLSYATFFSEEEGAFVETYISVNPNSIKYEQVDNGKYRGAVQVTLMFKQGEKVTAFDKYLLQSPLVDDTVANIPERLLDQKRFMLPSGDYDFTIKIADQNTDREPYVASEPVTVNYQEDKIAFSDMQMIDSYKKTSQENILTKNGYDLVPYPADFYPENKKEIMFYSELYNTEEVLSKNGMFLLKYYLQPAYTQQPMENYVRIRRMETRPVNIFFHKFNIEELPSGNYQLVMEVFNKQNELLASKNTFFQRSNPSIQADPLALTDEDVEKSFASSIKDKQVLKDYIKALNPVATASEKQFIYGDLNSHDLSTLQAFLYRFWLQRHPANTENAWQQYKEKIKTVQKEFKTIVKEGYEEDRGEIFLKYGPPNTVARSYNEPNAYPYETWHYYETDRHRDSKFVFYANDIVTNDFQLVHSNVPGEVKNRKWQIVVYGRNTKGSNVDTEGYPDLWGSKQEYYDNPY